MHAATQARQAATTRNDSAAEAEEAQHDQGPGAPTGAGEGGAAPSEELQASEGAARNVQGGEPGGNEDHVSRWLAELEDDAVGQEDGGLGREEGAGGATEVGDIGQTLNSLFHELDLSLPEGYEGIPDAETYVARPHLNRVLSFPPVDIDHLQDRALLRASPPPGHGVQGPGGPDAVDGGGQATETNPSIARLLANSSSSDAKKVGGLIQPNPPPSPGPA